MTATRDISNPRFLELQRKQLDAKIQSVRKISSPRDGWIRAVRSALAMSVGQLAQRLGMTPQGARELERREKDGSITLNTLSRVAEVLGCELRIAFVARGSLEKTFQEQLQLKAREERDRIVHTMRLEGQETGTLSTLKRVTDAEPQSPARLRRLWD